MSVMGEEIMMPGEDTYRFDWRQTRDGVRVYIEARGRWIAGIVVGRGRKQVSVMLDNRKVVKRPYEALRRAHS